MIKQVISFLEKTLIFNISGDEDSIPSGHNPSKTDVQKIQDELRKDGKEEVEFGDFLGVLAKYFKDLEEDPATELKQAFK